MKDEGGMMKYCYILDGHTPVLESNPLKWMRWFEQADRRVALTVIDTDEYVLTIFLGLDHNFGATPPFSLKQWSLAARLTARCGAMLPGKKPRPVTLRW
jgi:hypothetical protein